MPIIDPHPAFDSLVADLSKACAGRIILWPRDRDEMTGSYGGELDSALQMPGWTNVWTRPIQNRVDMLATGVRTMIGVKVYGNDLNTIQRVSNEIAAVLKKIPGAVDVVPDQPWRARPALGLSGNRGSRTACSEW